VQEMLTILTNVCGVCQSVMRLKSAAASAVYAACCVHGVTQGSLCQITLTTCCGIMFTGFGFSLFVSSNFWFPSHRSKESVKTKCPTRHIIGHFGDKQTSSSKLPIHVTWHPAYINPLC